MSWRKVFKLSATFFCIGLISISCKKETTNIGDSLQSESLNLQKIDTFTVVTYSDLVDSMDSDETSTNLLGSYVDPIFGKVDCGVVTQILPSSVNPDLGTSASTVMDSVVLSLRYSSLRKYGNLRDMTFEVYQITDQLQRDDQTYYTFDTPNITGSNLMLAGSETQLPAIYDFQIVGTDTLEAQLRLHLDPSFGDYLVAANEAGQISSDETFSSYFKGLYIKVDGSSYGEGEGAVLYLSLEHEDSKLSLYFHDSSTPEIAEKYSFSINSKAARYNEIIYDRSGTNVQALLDDKTLGEEEFYMQAGAIRAIVEFPHIMDFNYDSLGAYDPKIINRAELFLPVQDFEPDAFNPSTHLFVARVVDKKVSTFTVDYDFSSSFQAGNTIEYDEDAKEFRFIMTREIQALLTGGQENVGYRVYSPNFFASSIERIIFNGSKSPLKERPRLEITYTDY
ncbi:MAG: DUF4270 domain-containing protein [Flavobacteriales bacterium]|nr:DUF4270 domain-containing protein [Flavobacteriales bacterium]